jgi:ferrochelatase
MRLHRGPNDRIAVVLVNIGTPNRLSWLGVARFLRRFLSDPYVIDLPWMLRTLLVNLVIVPFRTHKTLHAYQQIWTVAGSPLLTNSKKLQQKLQAALATGAHAGSAEFVVKIAMSYSEPNLNATLAELVRENSYKQIIILPLYPQYATATTGSVLQAVAALQKRQSFKAISLKSIRSFHDHPAYIAAIANTITRTMQQLAQPHDYILFSYHGIPMRQRGAQQYRDDCIATTELIAQQLQLQAATYTTTFQSRLGRLEWTSPYTEATLATLAAAGVKNLVVVCPSFVVDCLETLEEIAIRAKDMWLELGGGSFTLVPCLNDNDVAVSALKNIILA